MLVFQLKIFTLEFLVSPGSRHVGEGDIVVVFFHKRTANTNTNTDTNTRLTWEQARW